MVYIMRNKEKYIIGKVYGLLELISLYKGNDGRMVAEVKCVMCGKKKI